jgi:hypothetical protein
MGLVFYGRPNFMFQIIILFMTSSFIFLESLQNQFIFFKSMFSNRSDQWLCRKI